MEPIVQKLIEEIKYELFHYPETTKKQDMKYVIKRLLNPKNTPMRDAFFWPQALLTQALEKAGEIECLKNYYDAWIEKGLPIYNLDNVMNGYSLLYLYEQTGEERYKEVLDRLYEYVCNHVNAMGTPMPYRKNHPTHVYIDGLGMIVPFLCRYGKVFGKENAIQLGMGELREFLKYGMDEGTGLPYHGFDTKTKIKQGIIGWGRAVGWLMLAMADSMEYLTEEKEEMMTVFQKLTRASFAYYRKDGYFSWQLTAMEGPKDTSATAMIGYAVKKVYLITEKKSKPEIEEYLKLIQKALVTSYSNGKIFDCSGECEGFSQYPQVYGAYPWSLGPGTGFLLLDSKKQ